MPSTNNKTKKIAKIAKQIANCHQCLLYKTAINPVPGEGNPNTKVVFIGEAPGYYEDQQGLPFVGRSGKLLDFCLTKINLQRSNVWIGNILKHRPPNNRDPLPQEIDHCRPYLDQQLSIINPKIIVTLGRFAMEKFISGVYISRVHGHPQTIIQNNKNIILFPMYHPAAALRSNQIMNEFKKDFVRLKRCLTEKKNNN